MSRRFRCLRPSRHSEAGAGAALLVGALLMLTACGGSDSEGSTPAASAPPPPASTAPPSALDPNGDKACDDVYAASRQTGDDVVSRAQRTRLLISAADAARQSSVPQIRDVPGLVAGVVAGSGSGQPLDQILGVCSGLGWAPSS